MLHTAHVKYEETARVISPTTKWLIIFRILQLLVC